MNYFDILLAKKLEDDRDPRVEGLSVTENGRYHEDGVVYDPVIVALPLDSKSITANGIYKASDDNLEGYDEVNVNVPLPSNAYLLKDIEGTPSAIATFTDGSALPMPKLEVGIEPIQSGSGDPSPENIRPIIGWDEVNVNVSGKNLFDKSNTVEGIWQSNGTFDNNNMFITVYCIVKPNTTYSIQGISNWDNWRLCYFNSLNPTTFTYRNIEKSDKFTTDSDTVLISFSPSLDSYGGGDGVQIEIGSTATTYSPYNGHTYTIDLNGTRYGGKVDLVSGDGDDDARFVDFSTASIIKNDASNTNDYLYYVRNLPVDKDKPIICSHAPFLDNPPIGDILGIAVSSSGSIYINLTSSVMAENTVEYLRQYCINNNVQIKYVTTTPTTIQLTPTLVKSLQGLNNVFADTGDIIDGQYFSKEE